MKYLKIILHILELVLLLAISAPIIYTVSICSDSETLKDTIQMNIVGYAWLFPISLPLIICVIISFFISLRMKNRYRKIVFGIHIFNISLIPLFLIFLPGVEEPTAKMMSENFKANYKDFMKMIEFSDSIVKHDGYLIYEIKEDSIRNIQFKYGAESISLEGKELYEKEGFPFDLSLIDSVIGASKLIGVEVGLESDIYSFLFRKYGEKKYIYRIYRSEESVINESKQYDGKNYILYNDTVAFVKYGVFPGNGEFVDYKQFQTEKNRQ